MSESSKKQRSGRVSKKQREKMLDLMRANKRVAMGKYGGSNNAKKIQAVWQEVAEHLNAVGGACKTAEQWKKSWADWKVSVKKQQTVLMCYQRSKVRLPGSEAPPSLQGLDTEVLDFIPHAVNNSCNETQVAGFVISAISAEDDLDLNEDTKPITEPIAHCATCHNSAVDDLKNMIKEQDERRNAQMELIIETLKSIDTTLKVLIIKVEN